MLKRFAVFAVSQKFLENLVMFIGPVLKVRDGAYSRKFPLFSELSCRFSVNLISREQWFFKRVDSPCIVPCFALIYVCMYGFCLGLRTSATALQKEAFLKSFVPTDSETGLAFLSPVPSRRRMVRMTHPVKSSFSSCLCACDCI